MKRHWTINGRFLTQAMTGVQRYQSEIVRALDAEIAAGDPLVRDLTITLVVPKGERRSLPLTRISTVEAGPLRGHAWEQLTLPSQVRDGLLSLGNSGPVAVRRQIVCLHDVNTRTFPGSYSRPYRTLQRMLVPILSRTAASIATVSAFSAGELVRYGLCDAGKLLVVPNGHEHVHRWAPAGAAAACTPDWRDTILMIGTPAPHKNVGLILGLSHRLQAVGLRIAIAGAAQEGVYQALDGQAYDQTAVTWLGNVTDAELAAILGSCFCLAFPSFAEGFGLPPLEAMALDCPVVVSDRTSLPEICGDAALYASPDDPDAWFESFKRLHQNYELRTRLIERGRNRVLAYSWRQSARRYLEAMRTLDGNVGRREDASPDELPMSFSRAARSRQVSIICSSPPAAPSERSAPSK